MIRWDDDPSTAFSSLSRYLIKPRTHTASLLVSIKQGNTFRFCVSFKIMLSHKLMLFSVSIITVKPTFGSMKHNMALSKQVPPKIPCGWKWNFSNDFERESPPLSILICSQDELFNMRLTATIRWPCRDSWSEVKFGTAPSNSLIYFETEENSKNSFRAYLNESAIMNLSSSISSFQIQHDWRELHSRQITMS